MVNGIDWSLVSKALSSNDFWTAVVSSVAIIVLGFVLAKVKFLPENFDKALTKLVMLICLPCLIFTSFMMTITQKTFLDCAFAFGYGFIIYTVMVLLSKVLFRWVKDPTKRIVFEIMFVFGSTNFFGQPIIQALNSQAFSMSNIYNVANLLYVFSYGYYSICILNKKKVEQVQVYKARKPFKVAPQNVTPSFSFKDALKKVFTNPIVIATLIGFFLWIMQLIGDNGWWMVTNQAKKTATDPDKVAFWMINGSCLPLYNTLKNIGGLSSPLIWISIGMVLGKVPLKDAARDKFAWIYSGIKIIGAPLINFLLLLALRQIPNLGNYVTFNLVFASTIMWATPTATVIVSYCVSSNKDPQFASYSYLISTIVGVVFMPILLILLTIVQSAGVFA